MVSAFGATPIPPFQIVQNSTGTGHAVLYVPTREVRPAKRQGTIVAGFYAVWVGFWHGSAFHCVAGLP